MSQYTTSQLAAAAQVGPQTLRYYERRGLLPEPPRTRGGHRIYGNEHLERLLFIQRAQGVGFDLSHIERMLPLESPGASGLSADEVDGLLATIDEKVRALQLVRGSLKELRSDGG